MGRDSTGPRAGSAQRPAQDGGGRGRQEGPGGRLPSRVTASAQPCGPPFLCPAGHPQLWEHPGPDPEWRTGSSEHSTRRERPRTGANPETEPAAGGEVRAPRPGGPFCTGEAAAREGGGRRERRGEQGPAEQPLTAEPRPPPRSAARRRRFRARSRHFRFRPGRRRLARDTGSRRPRPLGVGPAPRSKHRPLLKGPGTARDLGRRQGESSSRPWPCHCLGGGQATGPRDLPCSRALPLEVAGGTPGGGGGDLVPVPPSRAPWAEDTAQRPRGVLQGRSRNPRPRVSPLSWGNPHGAFRPATDLQDPLCRGGRGLS